MYTRVLLKLSGELLMGDKEYGIDVDFVKLVAENIVKMHKTGIELAIVIGGGNIFRGINAEAMGLDRANGDYMGMLATVMNALALQDAIEKAGSPVRICSALNIPEVSENFIRRRAVRHLEKKRIVILSAGTGNPYFTTDSAAALRGCELGCDVILKGTKVDGVYDKDPMKYSDAQRFETLTFDEAVSYNLRVMDTAAFSLCRDNNVPIRVFNLHDPSILSQVVTDLTIGTTIS